MGGQSTQAICLHLTHRMTRLQTELVMHLLWDDNHDENKLQSYKLPYVYMVISEFISSGHTLLTRIKAPSNETCEMWQPCWLRQAQWVESWARKHLKALDLCVIIGNP